MGDHVLYSHIENQFKHVHERVVGSMSYTLCMLMCTLVHIMDVRATLLSFAMIEYMI